MKQLLLLLEKVGITREFLRFTASLIAFLGGVGGIAVFIAAVSKNWTGRKVEWLFGPRIAFPLVVGGGLLVAFGEPPASYVGLLCIIFAFVLPLADKIRSDYFAPKAESKPESQRRGRKR